MVESLGSVESERAVSLIALAPSHPACLLARRAEGGRERAPGRHAPPREDWRALPLVTIDPPDAKDHDDAVHAAPDPDPANPGGFIVTVAIADVAPMCEPGGARPRGAGARQLGLFPRPRRADAARAHLQRPLLAAPAEDRPALAVRMIFGADGRKRPQRSTAS